MAAAREVYLPDHKWLEDSVLLGLPARGPFTTLTLFVCTYVAKLDNLHMNFVELTRVMCQNPHGCLLAANSNFGHAAQPGSERYLKTPKPPRARRAPMRGRPRKVQGDGTCFNSAVEPVITIDHPDLAEGKVYFVKCFPTTGETQVPGVVLPNLADGHLVLAAFVDYLNELGVGDEEPGAGEGEDANAGRGAGADAVEGADADAVEGEGADADAAEGEGADAGKGVDVGAGEDAGENAGENAGEDAGKGAGEDAGEDGGDGTAGAKPRRRRIAIVREQPNMINYKFRLVRNSPRILVNLYALSAYLCLLEHTKAVEGTPLTETQAARFAGWPAVVLPPYPVRETKAPTDDVKVSFRFLEARRVPRLNIFQEGKVNILGADSEESAARIYDFFARLFAENWSMLVALQPRRDLERRQALRAPRALPEPVHPPPPPATLTDSEVAAILADLLDAAETHPSADSHYGPDCEGRPDYSRGPDTESGLGARDLAVQGAVDDIVADLGAEEWGFESGPEDDEEPSAWGWPALGAAGTVGATRTPTQSSASLGRQGPGAETPLTQRIEVLGSLRSSDPETGEKTLAGSGEMRHERA